READGERCVREDLLQDRFTAFNQLCGRYHFVDEPDSVSLLTPDHLSGKNDLQRPSLADEPRQPLRSTGARRNTQLDLRLAEPGVFRGDPDCAGHRCLTLSAERKTVNRR